MGFYIDYEGKKRPIEEAIESIKRKRAEEDGMSYTKCYECPHVRVDYKDGLQLTCKITGESIRIKKCTAVDDVKLRKQRRGGCGGW